MIFKKLFIINFVINKKQIKIFKKIIYTLVVKIKKFSFKILSNCLSKT